VKVTSKIALVLATLALGATPAVALANGHGKSGSAPGHNKTTTTTSTTTTTTSSSKAWGRVCAAQNLSKKHVKGEKGTAFSRCVVAMAQLAKSSKTTPSSACSTESKKKTKGTSGPSDYAKCVAAAAQLRGTSH
jgi:hypothetical protein